MSFHVGQKVVCVDASPSRVVARRPLVLNREYVVDGIDPENGTGVYLVGDDVVHYRHWKHPSGWCPRRFRPVIERSTEAGMAVLRKVAADASKKRETVE